ncbi:hypothetical protein E2C01_016085 [Portunus trituberculatus]|uniref:Uncharacterized protein n=1 Tax=Portunus trituberculatus TaxID=210409 RepID=A0A5B7DPL1_PORTR|nr:hypothetical protein [Portunus trituberculatus]
MWKTELLNVPQTLTFSDLLGISSCSSISILHQSCISIFSVQFYIIIRSPLSHLFFQNW